ncbi:MAG: CopD family protein [Gammaproteobacteria bacterium]|nr:CopD family protein [Gammaproteobacteria bacterium]
MTILLALHALAAVIWVGGMAFAYGFLRPAAGEALEGPQRQALWRAVLARFFTAVWMAVGLLLLTGYWMVFGALGGFASAGVHIHIMNGAGILMMLLFAHVFFAPWRRYRQALDNGDRAEAANRLNQIRILVGINLLLGLAVVVVGASGRYWA